MDVLIQGCSVVHLWKRERRMKWVIEKKREIRAKGERSHSLAALIRSLVFVEAFPISLQVGYRPPFRLLPLPVLPKSMYCVRMYLCPD